MTKHTETVQVVFSDHTTKVVVGHENPNFSYSRGYFGKTGDLPVDDNGRTVWELFIQQLLIGASLQLISSPIGSREHLIAAGFICPHEMVAEEIGKIAKLSNEMVASATSRLKMVTFTHPNLKPGNVSPENQIVNGVVEFRGGGDDLYQFMLDKNISTRAWQRAFILDAELRKSTPSWLRFPRFHRRIQDPLAASLVT